LVQVPGTGLASFPEPNPFFSERRVDGEGQREILKGSHQLKKSKNPKKQNK
jgi:hypothetical protein